jgi:ubiquinol-cytochrome c reductase cytochrome b subunit
MRIFKNNAFLKLVNSYLVDAPIPTNISYLWNFGSLLAICLVIQIVTGVTLAMHYNPSVSEAFNSIEHIMRDVNNGWLLRYLHSNTASAFFLLVYLHIGRGLYYGSYKSPRTLTWVLGTIIFLLMIVTAFLGYVLPYGQMSLWGATVITNLMSAIPWVGQDIVEFLWGGFSVNNATLNRFFALHFVLPFVLVALVLMHLIALHDSAGTSNPLGISANYDRIPFAPYYLFKDLITIFIFIFILSIFVFFTPNALGDSDNYIMANPMQTPPSIVPEWYLLPFYAILRSIPNKLLGVIAMFSAILMLLTMPYTDLSRSRGIQFRPLSKIAFYIFVANFLILMQLGAKHVESPFIEFGQISTILYFSYFLIIVPFFSLLENSLIELTIFNKLQNNNLKNKVHDSINYKITLHLESGYHEMFKNVFYKILKVLKDIWYKFIKSKWAVRTLIVFICYSIKILVLYVWNIDIWTQFYEPISIVILALMAGITAYLQLLPDLSSILKIFKISFIKDIKLIKGIPKGTGNLGNVFNNYMILGGDYNYESNIKEVKPKPALPQNKPTINMMNINTLLNSDKSSSNLPASAQRPSSSPALSSSSPAQSQPIVQTTTQATVTTTGTGTGTGTGTASSVSSHTRTSHTRTSSLVSSIRDNRNLPAIPTNSSIRTTAPMANSANSTDFYKEVDGENVIHSPLRKLLIKDPNNVAGHTYIDPKTDRPNTLPKQPYCTNLATALKYFKNEIDRNPESPNHWQGLKPWLSSNNIRFLENYLDYNRNYRWQRDDSWNNEVFWEELRRL